MTININEITKAINERYKFLDGLAQEHQQKIVAAQADLNAVTGAKQDCTFWLNKVQELAAKEINNTKEVKNTKKLKTINQAEKANG